MCSPLRRVLGAVACPLSFPLPPSWTFSYRPRHGAAHPSTRPGHRPRSLSFSSFAARARPTAVVAAQLSRSVRGFRPRPWCGDFFDFLPTFWKFCFHLEDMGSRMVWGSMVSALFGSLASGYATSVPQPCWTRARSPPVCRCSKSKTNAGAL